MNFHEFDQLPVMLLRLAISALIGGILGFDRDLHRKPAGIRVLAMVCVGSCTIVMGSVIAVTGGSLHPNAAVLPAIQGVLSGIGFLGAGVIMHAQGKNDVHGMATAASIWVAAILGMVCGLGQIALAVAGFILTGLILIGGRRVEHRIIPVKPHDGNSQDPATASIGMVDESGN